LERCEDRVLESDHSSEVVIKGQSQTKYINFMNVLSQTK